MDEALFAIVPCRLEADYQAMFRDNERNALQFFSRKSDPKFDAFLTENVGIFCGTLISTFRAPMQMRIHFKNEHGSVVGRGTLAWGNLGQPNSTDWIALFPKDFDLSAKRASFTEISRFRSNGQWQFQKNAQGLGVTHADQRGELLRTCEGYWEPTEEFHY